MSAQDEFQKHIADRANKFGLPEGSSTDKLLEHTRESIPDMIANKTKFEQSSIAGFSRGAKAMSVEVRRPISPLELAGASIADGGREQLAWNIRRDLYRLLAAELMAAGSCEVSVQNDDVVGKVAVARLGVFKDTMDRQKDK